MATAVPHAGGGEDDEPRSLSAGGAPARDRDREQRRASRAAARDQRTRRSRDERPERAEAAYLMEPPPERGQAGRHTVTITGRGAEAYTSRRGTRTSTAQRHQAIRRHERDGFRPDRVAMWAVMLGVMLMLAAAASSHAAVLAHHLLAH
ncbi:MAG: hypothetical protein ABI355_05195 [Solirubrobacteraceae bacterium]